MDGGALGMSAALDAFAEYLDAPASPPAGFRAWVAEAPQRVVGAIEESAGWAPRPVAGVRPSALAA